MIEEPFFSYSTPFGDAVQLRKLVWDGGKNQNRLSIVAGLQGDHLNGFYLAGKIAAFLQSVEEGREPAYRLAGRVQLFPVVNAPGMLSAERLWPFDRLDLDMAFPGSPEGELPDRLCYALTRDTADSTWGLLLDQPAPHYEELLHTRSWKPDRAVRHGVEALGIDILRDIPPAPTLPGRLLYHWRESGMPACILSFGRAGDLDVAVCDRAFTAIVQFMTQRKILTCAVAPAQKTVVQTYLQKQEHTVTADFPGLFLPSIRLGQMLAQGQSLGELRDLYTGTVLQEPRAKEAGLLLAVRRYAVVYEKEPVATILGAKKTKWYWPF